MRIAATSSASTTASQAMGQTKPAGGAFQALLDTVSASPLAGQGSVTAGAKKPAEALPPKASDAVLQKQSKTESDEAELNSAADTAKSEATLTLPVQNVQQDSSANESSSTAADNAASMEASNPSLASSVLSLATSILAASIVGASPSSASTTSTGSMSAADSATGTATRTTGKPEQKTAANTAAGDAVATVTVPMTLPIVPAAPAAPVTVVMTSGGQSESSGHRSNGSIVAAEPATAHVAGVAAEHSSPSPKPANEDATLEAASQYTSNAAASSSGEAGFAAQLAGQSLTAAVATPASEISAGADKTQAGLNLSAKPVSDAVRAKNPDISSSADAASGVSASAVGGSAAAAVQDWQSNSSSTPHPQIDPSLAAAMVAKTTDSGGPQPQAVAIHTAAHDVSTTPRSAEGSPDVSRQGDLRSETVSTATPSGETAPTTGVNAAKLIQTMSESEMHVGMRSTEFGDISIRTSVSQQQMLAQISVDHSDLSQAIMAHVSSVQSKLGNEYGLNASIAVNHQGAGFSGDQGQSSQREQKGYTSSIRTGNVTDRTESDIAITPAPVTTVSSGNRLDIRA